MITTTAKEERNMRILLSFRNAKLLLAVLHKHFTKCIIEVFRRIGHKTVNRFAE
ncbi:hypothetical protein D3C84_1311530 [compost metagenome]